MKNVQNKLLVLLFLSLAFPYFGSSQDDLTNEMTYQVNKVYPYISIASEELREAQTLVDLNWRYKPSWVKEYISVEILTTYKGKLRKAISKNDILSQEQKEFMNTADAGKDIAVKVVYIPNNTLKHNDAKELTFTFTVDPEIEAKYAGGEEQLKEYLKHNAIDKIPENSFTGYSLAAVKFTIDEAGQITDAFVIETSKDEKIDELLLETINKMPEWKPAVFSNGEKTKQEFVLTVGNMESCVVNLLNIRRSPADKD